MLKKIILIHAAFLCLLVFQFDVHASTSAPNNIRSFIKSANLPLLSKRIRFKFIGQKEKVKIFQVRFGKPEDCEEGCMYNQALGIEHKGKIGWIDFDGGQLSHEQITKLGVYDFDSSDEYIMSSVFFKKLEKRGKHSYYTVSPFQNILAKDPDASNEALWWMASPKRYMSTELLGNLLVNETVKKDKALLEHIANLPPWVADTEGPITHRLAGEQIRYNELLLQARDLLGQL
ncbi:MAG: hypothetical protein AAB588_01035 [Patescibacteria group bacterium]